MTASGRGGVWRLAAILITAIVIWGWLLPWVGTWPATRQTLENTERLGINPSAVYYTDIFRFPEDFPKVRFPLNPNPVDSKYLISP